MCATTDHEPITTLTRHKTAVTRLLTRRFTSAGEGRDRDDDRRGGRRGGRRRGGRRRAAVGDRAGPDLGYPVPGELGEPQVVVGPGGDPRRAGGGGDAGRELG